VRDLTRAAPERAIANGGDGKVRAAMNGRVVAVLVKQGDRVEPGQPVVTLEAMKMEHVHVASVSGIIAELAVEEGEQVTTGKIVATIETGAEATS
jgi:geranyl-CoA carboxylase alpha subunit